MSSAHDDLVNSQNLRVDAEEDPMDSVNGPDTSSFSAFLYSFLAEPHSNSDKKFDTHDDKFKQSSEPIITKKKSLFSRGKHSLGKAFYHAAKIGGLRNQGFRGDFNMSIGSGSNSKAPREDDGISMQTLNESPSSEMSLDNLPETSEPSLLLSEKTRSVLYAELPVIVQGRKWMLLYRFERKRTSHVTCAFSIGYLEAWYIPFNIVQKKYDLAWPQLAGSFCLCYI
ncbi:hypothetical protein OROGR_008319 [Orobanche gracilis]